MIWSSHDLPVVRGFRCKRVIDSEALISAYDPQSVVSHEQYTARRQFQKYAWEERLVRCDSSDLVTETYEDPKAMQTRITVRWDPSKRQAEFIGGPWHGRPAAPGVMFDPYSSPNQLSVSITMSTARATSPYDPLAPDDPEVFVYEFYGWNPDTRRWVYTYGGRTK